MSVSAESRRRLGRELRELRERAGKSLEEVAERLDCSVAKVSRIETGQVAVRVLDLREFLDSCGVGGARRAALLAVARQQQRKDWWREYADLINDGYDHYVGYEEEATAILEYQPQWIPGLLQTHGYARALAEAFGVAPENAARVADLRMARQSVLRKADPPALDVVVDESALLRSCPDPEEMRAQLRRLLEPGPLVRVLPLAAGMHPAQPGGFIVLGLGPGDAVAYTDDLAEGRLVTTPTLVARFTRVFDALREVALSPGDSRAFIEALLD
ncbi:helix-turn-helix transcriptional regulator [Actinokineospora guangxiensis]|uniref:Helix-turn-helix transcriptional regulator n=1 Tax=Actinokineospora guangxiensis TaxID=1490288 RepID=A0ABW0EWE3_9PSEU